MDYHEPVAEAVLSTIIFARSGNHPFVTGPSALPQGIRILGGGEVAAVWKGMPQFDVGPYGYSDGAPRRRVQSVLRAMNPQIIALDEITAPRMFCLR